MNNLIAGGQGRKIVDTQFVQIFQTPDKYRVFIVMSVGGWVEHNPFDNDLRGLAAAMALATECCAGKFYLKRVAHFNPEAHALEHK